MLVVIMGMLIFRWILKCFFSLSVKLDYDFSGLAYVGEKDEEETMFISMPQVRHFSHNNKE